MFLLYFLIQFIQEEILKAYNFKIDAFDQYFLGCLGYMQDQEVYFYTQTNKIQTIKSRFNKRIDSIKSVAIAFYYSGADAKILYDLASDHEGIVIAGSGSGNYSQAWLKAIEELSEKVHFCTFFTYFTRNCF